MHLEYPKVIRAGGINVTVNNAADEARWLAADAPPVPTEAPEVETPVIPEAVAEVIHDAPEADDETHDAPKRPATHKGGKKK
jgi:hypothetical protein